MPGTEELGTVMASVGAPASRLRPAPGMALAVGPGAVATGAGAAWPTLGAPVVAVTGGVLLGPLADRRRGATEP